MALAIDAAMDDDPNLDILGSFAADDADVDAIRVRKTIYLPFPLVGIFLERDLTPVEAWSHLRGTIVCAGATVDC